VDSAANQALLKFLAQCLDCPRASLDLHRGKSSRHKIIAISGLNRGEVVKRLGLYLNKR